MRRALMILLAILIPLKSLAAVVVPIAGAVAIAAEAAHGDSAAALVDAAYDCCPDGEDGTPSDALHSHHSCPHLAMAAVLSAPLAPGAAPPPSIVVSPLAAKFDSIILDVPLPPPTGVR